MKLLTLLTIALLYTSTSYSCPEVNFDKVLCNDITNSQYFKGHLSLNIYEDGHSHVLSSTGNQFFWFVRIPSINSLNGITQTISCTDNKVIIEDTYNNKTYTSVLILYKNGFKVSGVRLRQEITCEDYDNLAGCQTKEPMQILVRSHCLAI